MRVPPHLLLLAATVVAQEPSWHVAAHEVPTVAPLAPDPSRATRVEALIDGLCLATSFAESKAANELVRLGPAAIPWLLKHLDDERETRLEVTAGAFQKAYAHAEVPVPSGRPEERDAMAAALNDEVGTSWRKADTGAEIDGHVASATSVSRSSAGS